MKKLSAIMMAALALGGGIPSIKMPESNTRMDDLPEGFREWWFNKDTGELLTDKDTEGGISKEMQIFRVTSRSEENAIKEFKRLNPSTP